MSASSSSSPSPAPEDVRQSNVTKRRKAHKFKDRGDGKCLTCEGPLLVGREQPHEADEPTEAK